MDGRLLGVQVIYRHGARTPVYTIPVTTPVLPPIQWPTEITSDVEETIVPFSLVDLNGELTVNDDEVVGKFLSLKELPGGAREGWLTSQGQQDMFKLGQKLRQRYVTDFGLISPQFNSQDVYSRSTRYPRNIDSARCVLAGLFGRPPDSGEKLMIHAASFEEEILGPNRITCALVKESIATIRTHDFPPGLLAGKKRAVELFGPNALIQCKKSPDGLTEWCVPSCLFTVRDELACRIYHGFPVSEEVLEFTNSLNRLCPLEMVEHVAGSEEIWKSRGFRATAGAFCHLILETLDEQAASRSHKMKLFATHDDMLITLLVMMELFEGEWPQFGADLVFELYERQNGSLLVRIALCDKVLAEMPLSEMKQLLGMYSVSPEEFKRIQLIGLNSPDSEQC